MATTSSFITSLVTSFVIFCLLMIVYAILSRRPGNAVIYYPLRILRGEDGPALAKRRGMFSWVTESLKASEDDIVAVAGLDAAVYMHLFTAGMSWSSRIIVNENGSGSQFLCDCKCSLRANGEAVFSFEMIHADVFMATCCVLQLLRLSSCQRCFVCLS